MSDKIHYLGKIIYNNIEQERYVFYCPGCKYNHCYDVPRWSWNGSLARPTFRPSLLINQSIPSRRCHFHVTEGKIQYCDDCHHNLKGKTVERIDWDDKKSS